MCVLKKLVGKTITEVWLDPSDQHYLKFVTDDGDYVYYAEGDCCSECWFYQISGFDALLGHTVLECEDVEMGEISDGKTRQEFDELYGVKIKTTGGRALLEFRNSSNGYYGGNLVLLTDSQVAGEKEHGWSFETTHDFPNVQLIQLVDDYQG